MVTVETEYVSATEDPDPCILIDGEGRATCAGMDRDGVAGGDDAEAHPDLDEETVAQLTTQLGESRSFGS